MAFEGLITRLNLLFQQMENQPGDETELLMQIHNEIARMRAEGMPPPQDLIDLEARLEAAFEQRGLKRPDAG